MAQYQRKPVDPQAPLQPGRTYELVLKPQRGDLSRVTRADLERALRQRYGEVRVLDWGRRGGDWVVRLTRDGSPSRASPNPPRSFNPSPPPGGGGCGPTGCYQPLGYSALDGAIQPAALPALPAVITAAAVVSILYLVWRIVADLKEAVELVPAPARAAAVAGAGIGAGALGLAALGVVVLALLGRRRRYA